MGKYRSNRKGFSLVELIIVIAVLAIVAAIAIPRYSEIQARSRVKADGATAAEIVEAARIQETDTTIPLVDIDSLDVEYMVPGPPQSGGTFVLTGGGTTAYTVTWTPDVDHTPYDIEQGVTENIPFELASN